MNTDNLNITNAEYVALSANDRIALNKMLRWNSWHNYHEMYPDIEEPEGFPCVINGTLILGD